jgi:hypothetical protein
MKPTPATMVPCSGLRIEPPLRGVSPIHSYCLSWLDARRNAERKCGRARPERTSQGGKETTDDRAVALPVIRPALPFRRRLSRRLLRAARDPARSASMTLGELVESLGERSIGWSMLVFAIVNMLPMPVGSNMVTSIPVMIVAAQVALGYDRLRLPAFVANRRVSRKGFQKLVLRLGPVMRPIERVLRPRLEFVFGPRAERLLGVFLLVVALALFAPIPLSGYLPAAALAIAGIGLIERDGLLTLGAVVLGVVAIAVTIVVGAALVVGAEALVR